MRTCSIQVYDVGSVFFRANKGEFVFSNIQQTFEPNDWGHSIYFSQNIGTARGYLDDSSKIMLNFTNKVPIKYILCSHCCFKGEPFGDYRDYMDSIVKEIELLVGVTKPSNVPFMLWLGEIGYAFQCYHDSETDSMETIVPLQLMKEENWSITR